MSITKKSPALGAEPHVLVRIPSLFRDFLASAPQLNPHYGERRQREAAIRDFCSFDSHMQGMVTACDFSYFMAISAPNAEQARFQTLCDWGNWVFPFDDILDNGELRDKPEDAELYINSLMSAMTENVPRSPNEEEKLKIIQWHDKIWATLKKDASVGTQRRFAQAMADYCRGALQHVQHHSQASLPPPNEMLSIRCLSAGVTPVFALVEYGHNLSIPDEIFEHNVMQEFLALGTEFVVIHNDMLSYRKEELEGVPHNLVAAFRFKGLSAQAAFDSVGSMLDSRFERWQQACESLPSWGAKVDEQVRLLIEGIANVVRANVYWSFKSGRYLGADGENVKNTGLLSVLEHPQYLFGGSPHVSLL